MLNPNCRCICSNFICLHHSLRLELQPKCLHSLLDFDRRQTVLLVVVVAHHQLFLLQTGNVLVQGLFQAPVDIVLLTQHAKVKHKHGHAGDHHVRLVPRHVLVVLATSGVLGPPPRGRAVEVLQRFVVYGFWFIWVDFWGLCGQASWNRLSWQKPGSVQRIP